MGGGIPPTTRKIDLSPPPPHVPPLFWPQNADFVIFMQFLAILSKLSLPLVDPNWETQLRETESIAKSFLLKAHSYD